MKLLSIIFILIFCCVLSGKTAAQNTPNRELRVEDTSGMVGQMVTVNLRYDAVGDETEIAFTLTYDQTKLSIPIIEVGNAEANLRICNTTITGRINCAITGFTNNNPMSEDPGTGEIPAGMNQILTKITFTIAADTHTGDTMLTLSNVNATNDNLDLYFPTARNGVVTILASPTAASVSINGRVMTAAGRGISGVPLTLIDSQGNTKTTVSAAFGYYRFDNLQAGLTNIITASGKHFSFNQSSQVLNINDDSNEVNFIANPVKRYTM